MTEFWIWSNQHGAWWRPGELGYTRLLHEAGRYPQFMAEEIVKKANIALAPTAWPDEVAIPVVNEYLPDLAQLLIMNLGPDPGIDLSEHQKHRIIHRFTKDLTLALEEES